MPVRSARSVPVATPCCRAEEAAGRLRHAPRAFQQFILNACTSVSGSCRRPRPAYSPSRPRPVPAAAGPQPCARKFVADVARPTPSSAARENTRPLLVIDRPSAQATATSGINDSAANVSLLRSSAASLSSTASSVIPETAASASFPALGLIHVSQPPPQRLVLPGKECVLQRLRLSPKFHCSRLALLRCMLWRWAALVTLEFAGRHSGLTGCAPAPDAPGRRTARRRAAIRLRLSTRIENPIAA